MEQELIYEASRLLEKTGFENLFPQSSKAGLDENSVQSILVQLKSLNARYEKSEALDQVQWLMNTYNIQIDELMERISS